MEKILKNLSQVNWDFSDYNSLKFPLDVNSIPWYPATLIPPIPKFLIALLSKEKDIVFDPFGGKGTTAIEAIKQNRRFCFNDLNPFATDMLRNIVNILECAHQDENQITNLIKKDSQILRENILRTDSVDSYIGKDEDSINLHLSEAVREEIINLGIDREAVYWYHIDTLHELANIYRLIKNECDVYEYHIRKLAFVSILKEVCSQRGHFTYITDNCRPARMKYYDAITAYFSMLDRINNAVSDFIDQFYLLNYKENLLNLIRNSQINCGDSRNMGWMENNSVDFVITSPPYLCAQDYIKTMRLINLFFPEKDFKELASLEIGARAKRRGKSSEIVQKFYEDMNSVLGEISRVLKGDKYFCLVMGQGKGKITEGYDTIGEISDLVVEQHNFEKVFQTRRKINYKSVRVGGVDFEEIIIFQKKK